MHIDDFDSMNALSERVLLGNATPDELQEFKKLVDEWNDDLELNLFNREK